MTLWGGRMATNLRRREFITLLGGAAAWPFSAHAQQSARMPRVGVLMSIAENDPEAKARLAAFQDGLQKLGWTEGRNLQIDHRWGEGEADRIRAYALELVGTKPDVIVAVATNALSALRDATRTIPIVFVQIVDPIRDRYVASLARPGGNITGFMQYEYSIAVKWLELLKQIAPRVSRVAVMHDPSNPVSIGLLRTIEAAGPSFGTTLIPAEARGAADIERAFDALGREPNGGLIVVPGPVTTVHREKIIALADQRLVPTVYAFRAFVVSGGLASYGVDNLELYRGAAAYVDRILKCEKPGDLPVQAATKFELVINLKTARKLGLEVPIFVLARADEVIE
jgi:putative tryptophan/tyrosine transport system substrate-binding protein